MADRAPGAPPLTTFAVEGSAGSFKLNLQGDAGNAGDATALEQLAQLVRGKLNLSGRIEAVDAVGHVAFSNAIVVSGRPGRR